MADSRSQFYDIIHKLAGSLPTGYDEALIDLKNAKQSKNCDSMPVASAPDVL